MSAACGTTAGYQAHGRRGEERCAECVEAHRRNMQKRRLRLTSGRAFTYPVSPARNGLDDFDGLGATIARSFKESA